MARAKPPKPAEEQQPALFAPEQLATLPQLVSAARAYLHTGRTSCKDEERAQEIVQSYLCTQSLLGVARRYQVSPNTVKAILQVFEAAGKLDDLKQRVSGKLGLVAELASDASIEALLAGKVPANVLPIMVGVAIEKKALLDGEATERVQVEAVRPVQVEDVARYVQAIDVESTGDLRKDQEKGGSEPEGTRAGTPPPPPTGGEGVAGGPGGAGGEGLTGLGIGLKGGSR